MMLLLNSDHHVRDRRRWAMLRGDRTGRHCVTALLLSLTFGHLYANAQAPSGDGFEGAETSWRFAEADSRYQVQVHQRTSEGAHSGVGCEVARMAIPAGHYVSLSLDIAPAHVIAELRPSLWVRTNRPGVQFLARVIFPHTADPRTGKPLARLVGGTKSSQPGTWQQLRIDNLAKLVAGVVPPMRAQYGSHIDVREAYVDRLVLSVPGGPGASQVAIDDLDLPHVVPVDDRLLRSSVQGAASASAVRRRIELVGSVLEVDGHPFFPRMVEHQGESLSFLKGLGFNVVKLAGPPTPAVLDEAKRTGVWLVCPPPVFQAPDENVAAATSPEPLDDRYDPVLAWHLGQGLTSRDLEAMERWVDQIRRADDIAARPLVCDPADELERYSRLLGSGGILMMHRYLLGSTFELADYSTWLRIRPRLGMPGMPVWTTIETQHSRELSEQIALLSSGQAPEPVAEFEQIRLMVQAALAGGVRGLSFASRTPLDAQDAPTRMRAMLLALVNLELWLIEDWVAAGIPAAQTISAANQAGVNPGITGAILQAGDARLLLPLWTGTGAQYVPDQLAGNLITFVVPGAPEANSVYELTAGGLRTLDNKRLVGGRHVKQNEFGLTSLILLTNGIAAGEMNRRLIAAGPIAADHYLKLAAHKLDDVTEVDRQLARLADRVLEAQRLFAQARNGLDEAKENLKRNDWLATCLASQRAMRPLRVIERSHWEKAIASLGSPAASPLVATFGEIPYHWLLARELESLGRSRSVLEQGDLETLKGVWDAGWRLYKHAQASIKTMPGQFSDEHYSGRASLHLSVAAVDPDDPPPMLETPPLWLTSPTIDAEVGQWFRIHGWVKVPRAIEASLDGLMILDTLTREPLAERIGKTEGWKEFTLYRAAPVSGPWRLTFALTGIGDAWIDGVTIETLRSSRDGGRERRRGGETERRKPDPVMRK